MANILIQLFWAAIALFIGVSLACHLFDSMIWRSIFGGLFSLVAYFIMGVMTNWIKAMKDPDVQIASDLRMSVKRYRKYQRLYDEYAEFMDRHGTNSHASEEKFEKIFKQIDNPNEWRRYQDFRFKQSSSVSQLYEQWKKGKGYLDKDPNSLIFNKNSAAQAAVEE